MKVEVNGTSCPFGRVTMGSRPWLMAAVFENKEEVQSYLLLINLRASAFKKRFPFCILKE